MTLKMSVRNMLLSAGNSLKKESSTFNSYVNSLTELDILCIIITITNETFYDYYDLAPFRAASPCSGIARSVVQLAVQKAANLTGEYTSCTCGTLVKQPLNS